MLIPIHIAFIDLLNGHFRFIYEDLIQDNPQFAKRIKEQVFIINNLTLVLGTSKRQLIRQLKKGMKHPDAPNDKRGLVKRPKDGKIDVVGLSYETLNLIQFYQAEKKSSQIKGLGDEDLMTRIFRQQAEKLEAIEVPEGSEPSEETITSLAEYQGEMTENHYGAQSIGHSMPSERNLSLGTAVLKIIKRATLLYRLALADNKNINQPMGGPNPFWLGVIMHCISDSYSTVHTFRAKYSRELDKYFTLEWQPDIDDTKTQRLLEVKPKFRKFIPQEGQIYFSRWELKSTFSLFSRCLSNYFDNHFNQIYTELNTFSDPEALIDFIIKTVCNNYCSLDRDVSRIVCRTCQRSVLCRTLRRLDLFDPDHPDIETFQDAYASTESNYDYSSMPTYYRLEHFQRFVTGYKDLPPKQMEIRAKVIETINRLLFFKFRERELKDLFQYPNLLERYREMIEKGFADGEDHIADEDDIGDEEEDDNEILELIGGGSLWDAFKSTVNDIFQTARISISTAPKLSQFQFYDKSEILRDIERRRLNQSYIIDFHDYEKQKDPPDLHLKCDYVQHPSLLEEIYDNLIHLTELYSHHINYLYKLRLKSGENIRETFYEKYNGDINKIGDAHPDYSSHSQEEYKERMRTCIEEFYQYIYQWVFKINSKEAFESQIKRFFVNADSCLARSEELAEDL